MSRAPLPPLNPDERILLTRETDFRKRQLAWLLLFVPVSWLIGFVGFRFVAVFRGSSLPPLADALLIGAFVLLAVMIAVPIDWLMQRGRVWAVTNQRIIDNKGLDLPIARIDRVSRRGAIFSKGITPFDLPGVKAAELRAMLLPLLGTLIEQFPSVMPPSGLPQGLPLGPASQGAAFWSPRLQPGEILLWTGQERALLPILLILILTPLTALSLFGTAQSIGLLECGRSCPPMAFSVPVSALLVVAMIALLFWLRHPSRYAITDRRALVAATALQRATRVGTGSTELPLLGTSFSVEPTEVWIEENHRGNANRFVAMMGLPRREVKALERLLFALIRRSASQTFLPPPQP